MRADTQIMHISEARPVSNIQERKKDTNGVRSVMRGMQSEVAETSSMQKKESWVSLPGMADKNIKKERMGCKSCHGRGKTRPFFQKESSLS